jgi:hypothetical protein
VVVTKNVAGSTQVATPDFDAAAKYIEETGKPAARRDLLKFKRLILGSEYSLRKI